MLSQGNVPPITFTSPSSVPVSNRRGSGINLKNLDDLGPRLPTAFRKVQSVCHLQFHPQQ